MFGFTSLLVLLLLLERSLSGGLHNPQVQVKPLIIARGEVTDLQDSFRVGAATKNTTGCKIRYVYKPQLSCGYVSPSVFSCDYEGALTYQHYGCLNEKELVTFQLSVTPNDNSSQDQNVNVRPLVQVFSIELHIEDSVAFSGIQLRQTHPLEEHTEYRLIFHNDLVGKCYYELLTDFSHLSLPSFGKMTIEPTTVLPCGYISKLQYTQELPGVSVQDHVLLRLYKYDHPNKTFYSVIPLERLHGNSARSPQSNAKSTQTSLSIRQAINTPVTPDTFIVDMAESFGLRPIKYRVEVHPHVGCFCTVQSTEVNVSYTEFTQAELMTGSVTFYPDYNAFKYSPVTFRYSAILDSPGSMFTTGVINVTIHDMIWKWPVQRTNRPLRVSKGRATEINCSTIDFYLLDQCISEAAMQLSVPPLHGQLLHHNRTLLSPNTKYLVKAIGDGTAIVYEHSGDDASFDSMVWEISCLSGPTMKFSMAVLIAQADNTPPIGFNSSKMLVFQEWSKPLSMANFQIVDPDSPVMETMVNVHKLSGLLIKVNHTLEFNASSWLFPLVKLSPINSSSIVQFTLREIQQQLVWYTPPEDVYQDTIEFSLSDTKGNHASDMFVVDIEILQSFNETVFISTTNDYPSVMPAAPTIRIFKARPVYITSFYLYAAVPPVSDKGIVYLLTVPPENGHLCILSTVTCTTSTVRFTQQDINQQRLFFSPSQNFTEEVIKLEVTVNGIRAYTPNLLTLRIELEKKQVKQEAKTFWVYMGREKRIRAWHFPMFPKKTIFRVTEGSVYGSLSYREGTTERLVEFTRRDLFERKVWYKHDPTATTACSDSFSFDIISEEGNQTKSSVFPILIRQDRRSLGVNITSGRYLLFEDSRFVVSRQSFQVGSSFCPEFVTFQIVLPPRYGALSVIDVQNNLVLLLETNDTFTLRDIYTGLLHYTLFNSSPTAANISDLFILNASDPVSTWPPEGLRQPETEHFPLFIQTMTNMTSKLDLKITSPRAIAWLPLHSAYGAILSQRDIDISNSTVSAGDVSIQNQNYIYQVRNRPSSVFTLEDAYSGLVAFTKLMFLREEFQDIVQFDVIIEIRSENQITSVVRRENYSLVFVWAFIELDREIIIYEEEGSITFTIWRRGVDLWFESRLLLTTHSGTAVGANCSSSNTTAGADFCHLNQLVTFQPNTTTFSVTIQLLNDNEAESDEVFTVKLSQPENGVLCGGTSDIDTVSVTINDRTDYAVVRFEGEAAPANSDCKLQLYYVDEGIGVLVINLTRSGNIHDRVGVLCRTTNDSALEGLDFVGMLSEVWFEINQTSATCDVAIINDPLYETSELFTVDLEQIEDGKALPDDHYSQLCVYIASDINDEPEVSFSTSEITVHESDPTGNFKILRNGLDLRNRTVLKYGLDIGGTATLGDDFMIYAGDTDMMNCNELGTGVGCVVFAGDGSPERIVSFKILQDEVYEGNETFYLTILGGVTMAHLGYPNRLRVTIVDSSEPSTIGFETPHKVVSESTVWSSVGVIRTGNLDTEVEVTCVFKAISATFSDSFTDNVGDVVIAIDSPERITFTRGQNKSVCPFGVKDDNIYEVEERFIIYLETDDIRAVIPDQTSSTNVSVIDPEDIPTVQFSMTRVTVSEPLSNYVVDSHTVILPLVRSGDTEPMVAIEYQIIDRMEVEESDFFGRTAHGIVPFGLWQVESDIRVELRADHDSNEDEFFTVLLSEIDATTSVAVGRNRSVIVHVRNTELRGPILPGIPVLVNRDSSHPVMVDTPLHCFSPCMLNYQVEENERSQYTSDCQSIDLRRAVYSWEFSMDGQQFHPFSTNTVLTTVTSQYLSPIYLRSGMLIRCSCTPVSEDGFHGYTRTSEVVELGESYSCEGEGKRAEMGLRSYDMFSARSEDLVEVSVLLPRISNALPVVLTQHPEQLNISKLVDVSNGSVNEEQVCSSINNFGILPNRESSWYSDLNYNSCEWTFRLPLTLEHLLHQCQANITFTESTIEVSVHVMYVYIDMDQMLQVETVQHSMSKLNYTSTSLYLPPPFQHHPTASESDTNAYIYPISVEQNAVYLCSVADYASLFNLDANKNLTLLYTAASQAKYIWKLTTAEPLSITDTTTITLYKQDCTDTNCTFTTPVEFKMKFRVQNHSFVPVLEITDSTQLKNSTNSSVFTIGDVVLVRLKLAKHQKIQPGFSLVPTGITLLLTGQNSTSSIDVWKSGSDDASTANRSAHIRFTGLGEDKIVFYMNTEFIQLEESNIDCTLTISWALVNSTGNVLLMQTNDIALTLLAPVLLTSTPDLMPELHDSLKAAIAIFVVTLVLASLAVVAVGLMICSWRGQAGLRIKVQQHHIIASRARRISAAASGRTKVSKGTLQSSFSALRRTHSTTGFPATVENYKRDRHKNISSTPTKVGFGGTRATLLTPAAGNEISVPRCRSLPNLAELQISAVPLESLLNERRRNLNKIHTRVSTLNSHHTESQRSSSTARKRLLKAYKVDNLKTLQDITPKRNNYGVNEGKINTEKEGYRKEFASFAVRSIAASAKTPEPGSSPRTAL